MPGAVGYDWLGLGRRILALAVCCALAACVVSIEEGEPRPSSIRTSISNENRLALNRLALNRLALNRLALNRLALDGIGAADDLLATEDGRDILVYIAQCALEHGDALVGEHEGEIYEFPGLLGLATDWEERALYEGEQQRMSACLLAHVNAYDTSVSISLRAHGILEVTEPELRDYPVYEGAFFGQVFDGEVTRVFACQGSLADTAAAHSADRAVRVCTDASEDCEIITTGRCREVCDWRTEEEGWRGCWAGGERYDETINVFLHADDPSGENHRCEGKKDCEMSAREDAAAILDCNGSKDCSAFCAAGSTCTIDAARSKDLESEIAGADMGEVDCYRVKDCTVECYYGARCDVGCYDGKDCRVECCNDATCDVGCQGKDCRVNCRDQAQCRVLCRGHRKSCEAIECRHDASCEIDCRDNRRCDFVTCRDSASCLLRCNDADECEFHRCDSGAMNCPGNIAVCGRPCP